MNNAYANAIFKDTLETLNNTLKQEELLDLNRIYEIRRELLNFDIMTFLFPLFSVIFLTIGLFILGQVTSTYDKTRSDIQVSLNNVEMKTSNMINNITGKNDALTTSITRIDDSLEKISNEYVVYDNRRQVDILIYSIQTSIFSLKSDISINKQEVEHHFTMLRDNIKILEECYDNLDRIPKAYIKNLKYPINAHHMNFIYLFENTILSLIGCVDDIAIEDLSKILNDLKGILNKYNTLFN